MLASKIIEVGPYPFINLDEYSPVDAKKRYLFIKEVKNGAQVPTILLTYSPGNNVGNSHFIWHVPDETLSTASSQRVIEEIKTKLPIFHSCLIKRECINKFGKISSSVKPAVLRYFYHDLTGDSSGSETMNQEEVNLHAIEIEDFEIVADLRHLNSGNKTKYDVFWDECGKFLEQNIGTSTAVDDRRHIGISQYVICMTK